MAKDAILVKLFSSLCQKIDKLGGELLEDRRLGNQHGSAARRGRPYERILCPPKITTPITDDTTISSVAHCNAKAVAQMGDNPDHEEAGYGDATEFEE